MKRESVTILALILAIIITVAIIIVIAPTDILLEEMNSEQTLITTAIMILFLAFMIWYTPPIYTTVIKNET
jgi:ABC-type nickel/cobalt efflux system permease component RcnA